MTYPPGTVLPDGSIQSDRPGIRWESGVILIPETEVDKARSHGWEILELMPSGLRKVRRK